MADKDADENVVHRRAKQRDRIGMDMSRYRSVDHLALWTEICPWNERSAGKQLSGTITKDNTQLKSRLCEIAVTIARTGHISTCTLSGHRASM